MFVQINFILQFEKQCFIMCSAEGQKERNEHMKKDGIYFGLSESEYFSEDRIGSTELRTLIDSPSRFWFESFLNPLKEEKDTKPLNEGKIFHKLILEGEKAFERDYVIAPKISPYTNEYKAWKKNQVKEIVKEDDLRKIQRIIRCIKSKKSVLDNFFKDGFPEVSILWTDEKGIKRRTRIDYLKIGQLIDLKSFTDWKNQKNYCARYFWDYKVFVQLQDYMSALKAGRTLEVIKGTAKQKAFWEECCKVDEWLPWGVFVSREIPKYEIHTYEPSKCPDLYRLGQEMIRQAQANFDAYFEKFGLTNTWIEEQDPETIQFTDADFPQMIGML